MTQSNDQGQGAAAIPVWDATGKAPAVGAAIPMFKVTGSPVAAGAYPNDQGLIAQNPPQGAIPIKVVSEPTPNADDTYPSDPGNVNSAIPVYFVASAPADIPPYPTDPSSVQGAMPAWVVA